MRRIFPRIASRAVIGLFAFATSLLQTVKRKIAQGIRSDVFADLFDGFIRGDELVLGWSIHAVKTWGDGGRTGNPHVDFFGSGVADHADDLAAGGAAHDGIVNQNHAFAFEQRAHRIQLEFDAKITDRLARFNERAAHVVIADEAKAKRNAAFGRKAHGGGNAGVGYRDNDVGVHGSFKGQLAAQFFTTLLHEAAEDDAVWAGKINVFEDAA